MFLKHSWKGISPAGGALVVLLTVQSLSSQYVLHDLGRLDVVSSIGFIVLR
jgi:hypothetical protein